MKTFVVFVILLHVSQQDSVVEVYEGEESVILPCHVSESDSSGSTVAWNRKIPTLLIVHLRKPEGDKLSEQNQQYIGRTSMRTDALQAGDVSLTLTKPTVNDIGTYTCTVRRGGEDLSRTEVHLLVKEPPPPVWPKVLAAVLVTVVVLPVVVGYIMYSWYKDRRVQQVEVESGLESVQLPCRTTVQSVCSLDYLVRLCCRRPLLPEDVKVEWTDIKDRKVHVYENDSDHPEEQIRFYRGRTEMKRNLQKTGDLSLTLKQPMDRDSNIYTCSVYNKEGNIWMKKQVELRVKVPQVEVDSGVESVQLPCKTTVHLPEDVRVKWRDSDRNNVHVYENSPEQHEKQHGFYRGRTEMKRDLLKSGDLSLTLKYPTDRHSNIYTCTVYSREGNILVKKQMELRVKVPQVEVDSGVESVKLPCTTTVHLPEDVRVEWTDSKDGKVHVYQRDFDQSGEQNWFYSGRTEMKRDLLKTGDLSLTLKYPTDRDSNIYTCTVYSREGNILVRKEVELRVEVDSEVESVQLPCQITFHLPEDVRGKRTDNDSDSLHLYDNYFEQPKEQHQFYKDRTEMETDLVRTGDLSRTLKYLTDRDRDIYTCSVYSREGNILMKKQVELWVKDCQVEVEEGVDSVDLPFRTTGDLPEDATVLWRRDLAMTVHVYHNGSDQPEEQNQIYRGRTEMKQDLLRTGDLSLTLKYPTDRDGGGYLCDVLYEGVIVRQKYFHLTVQISQVKVGSGEESVQLPCKTTVHLPEDVRVEWTDSNYRNNVHVYENSPDQPEKQTWFYRGRTEMKKDLLKTGDLSLTLNYPTDRDSNIYTCTVYNREGNILMRKQVELWVKDCQVEVEEGVDSVELPFKTTGDLPKDTTVVWRCEPVTTVHVYYNSSEQPGGQHRFYRGQTEMKRDLVKTGDLSLTLKYPTDRDTGTYVCDVRYKGIIMRHKIVHLIVQAKPKIFTDPAPPMAKLEVEDETTADNESTPLKTGQHV